MSYIGRTVLFSIVSLLCVNEYVYAIRTKDKMYEDVDAANVCYRRLNATHQTGCTSKKDGSTGAIHFCESQSDLDFILKNGTAAPYVPIIPTKLFTKQNVNKLRQSSKISGLLLYATQDKPDSFTHESSCPNVNSNIEGTCQNWNPLGTGLLHEDIPFPIFYVEDEENIKFARECFVKYNNFSFNTQRDRSLCSLELTAFMYATINSPTCIRRSNMMTNLNPVKFCDPLGDKNVWASLFPLVKGDNLTEPKRDFRYIVVAARLDATSLFDKTAGAVSPITGLVALLSVAQFLKTLLPKTGQHTRNVLFLVFNGETYDYIGSQRFVYDLLKGNFPTSSKEYLPAITMEDIDLYVELSQLSHTETVVAHYLQPSHPSKFVLILNQNKGDVNLDEAPDSLPPASVHSFLKNRTALPSLVLADHKGAYVNKFYNSIYDNATNLNYTYLNLTRDDVGHQNNIQTHIQKVAAMVAKSLYMEITGGAYEGSQMPDLQIIDELLHCYLENAYCKVHRVVQRAKTASYVPPMSLYVGVERSPNVITPFVGLTLGWLTGDVTGASNINCTNEPRNYAIHYYNMSSNLDDLNATLCYRVTMNFTDAVSPAFIIDDYDWSSGKYSSWTESTWGQTDIKLRVFLKPSAAHENTTIAVGSMVFILSLLVVYFVKSKSHILFAPHVPTVAPTSC